MRGPELAREPAPDLIFLDAMLPRYDSVGKPKDGDRRAGYVILETGRRPRVEFRRVEYDMAAAARAVRESGLPPRFAEMLETGGRELRQQPAGVKPG